MGFLKLLRRLFRLSGAVDLALDADADVTRRKAALVTLVTTALSIVEDKLHRDLANDEGVREAAADLADAIFESIAAVREAQP